MRNFANRLYLKFKARKTTISLIAALAFVYFLGLVIPQKAIVPPEVFHRWKEHWPLLVKVLDSLRLTRIYSSPPVIALTVLFFLNLLLVTIERIPAVIRGIKLPARVAVGAAQVKMLPFSEVRIGDRAEIEAIKKRLAKKGFRMIDGEDCFKGVKHRFSTLGSLFFHLSFILFLAGGLLMFHTRFKGETFVTEGQSFHGERGEYKTLVRLSELRKTLPEIAFTVEKIEPRFKAMEPLSLRTRIRVLSRGIEKTGVVDVNRPYSSGTTSILVADVGVSPYMAVTDATGKEVFGAYVSLNVIRGDEDHFEVPGTDYDVKVRYWPDYALDTKGDIHTRSYYPRNPLFSVHILKDGAVIASGKLKGPRDYIAFDGKRLRVRDLRYYGRFVITDEKGGGLLILGFVFSIVGLMLKFIWTRKEVFGVLETTEGETRLLIGYKAEYLKALGKVEFERLLAQAVKHA